MRVSIIYFLRNPKWGLIKIGTSYNIEARINDLSADAGVRVEFLGAFIGTFEDERATHEQFSEWRVACEWFHPADDLLTYIKENAYLTLDDTIQLHRSLKNQASPSLDDPARQSVLFGAHSHQQHIADQLNGLMHVRPMSQEQAFEKWAAYKTLVIFEQSMWIPRAFEDAYLETADLFSLDDKGNFRHHFGYAEYVWRDIERLLVSYLDRLPSQSRPEHESQIPSMKIAEAAAYLNLSVEAMMRYVFQKRKIAGALGRDGIRRFSADELDRWKAQRPKRGRHSENEGSR